MAAHQWRRRFALSRQIFNRFFSSSPPLPRHRRVVVTGMVTPLGCGVEATWKNLIGGEFGVRALTADHLRLNAFDVETRSHVFNQLTSKVVTAIVPEGSDSGQFDHLL